MRIKFSRLSWDTEAAWDIINGNGFFITDMPYSDVDKSIRNMDGPRSPRYGTTFNDVGEFAERYHCKCGKYVGAQFEGEMCPECNTKIEYTDVNILFTGYISFAPFHLINP